MDAFAWIITVLHHFVFVFPKKHQYWDGYTLFYPCVLGSSPWNPHFWQIRRSHIISPEPQVASCCLTPWPSTASSLPATSGSWALSWSAPCAASGSGRTWWRTTRRCGAVRVPSSGLVVSTCFNKMFQRCFDDLLFFFYVYFWFCHSFFHPLIFKLE